MKKRKIGSFMLASMLAVQVLGGSSLYAATSKMTNTIHKAYSKTLKSTGSGLKSGIYADLDQDGIEELLIGKFDRSNRDFYLQVYKYKNNTVQLMDEIVIYTLGSNSAGMNNFTIAKSSDGNDVVLKRESHRVASGYATWVTTYYKLKNGKLNAYAVEDGFSDAGAVVNGKVTERIDYQVNGKKVNKASYVAAVKKYTVENKMIDTGYSPEGGDKDDCKDYTKKGSAIHNSVKEDIKLVINGQQIQGDHVAPVQIGGSTLVPIRVVSQYLGAEISWKNPIITVTKGGKVIKLALNNKTALINNQKVTLDVAPTIVDGVTMVPLRFVTENLSATTKWNNKTQTVEITANSQETSTEATKEEATSSTITTNMALLGQGVIDTLPYKMGTKMSVVTKDLGEGKTQTYQGVRLHEYSNYGLHESLYSPILTGGLFFEGYTMYGFTIGKDNAQQVKKQLGTPGEVYTDFEGDEFDTAATTYCYMYSKNNYYLAVYFNAKDIIERAVFIDKN